MIHYPDIVVEFLHLFSSNLVEMTTSSSRTFLMEAVASGGLTPCIFLPFSPPTWLQSQAPGQMNALAELPNTHLLPVQTRSKSQNLGKSHQTRSLAAAGVRGLWLNCTCYSQLQKPPLSETHPSSCVKRKIITDFYKLMAKLSLTSVKSRFHLTALLSQPSRELHRENTTEVTVIICLFFFPL